MSEKNKYYIKIETSRKITMKNLKKKLIKQGHDVKLIGQRFGNAETNNSLDTFDYRENGVYGDIETIVDNIIHYGNYDEKRVYMTYGNEEDFTELSLRVVNSYEKNMLQSLLLKCYKNKTGKKISLVADGFDILLSVDDIRPWEEDKSYP